MNGWCAACFADALGESWCRCPENRKIRLTHQWTRPLKIQVLSPHGLALLTTTVDVADNLGCVLRRLALQSVAWQGYRLSCGGQALSDSMTALDLRDMFAMNIDEGLQLRLLRGRKRPFEQTECVHCGSSIAHQASAIQSTSQVPDFLQNSSFALHLLHCHSENLLAIQRLQRTVEALLPHEAKQNLCPASSLDRAHPVDADKTEKCVRMCKRRPFHPALVTQGAGSANEAGATAGISPQL